MNGAAGAASLGGGWLEAPPAAFPVERDIAFDAADFQRVRSLIRAKAGIDLNPSKQNMVYSRLARRLRQRGHSSFRSYLDQLQGDAGPEWQEFINCLTTNLTAFFREPYHFEMLAQRLRQAGGVPVRIWSCAASTGEEPYSIAITALETLGRHPRVAIDASDIDTRVLATAEQGVYPLESVAQLGQERLRAFFLKGSGTSAGKVRVKPELRALVSFRPCNLLAGDWQDGPYDFVFCRNVMIYFDRAAQRQVLQRLHGCMRPNGLLFVGHSENFSDERDLFQLVGHTAYRRAA